MNALFLARVAFITLPTSSSHPSVKSLQGPLCQLNDPVPLWFFTDTPSSFPLGWLLAKPAADISSDFLLIFFCVSSLQGPMTLTFLMGGVALTAVNVHGSLQSHLDGTPSSWPTVTTRASFTLILRILQTALLPWIHCFLVPIPFSFLAYFLVWCSTCPRSFLKGHKTWDILRSCMSENFHSNFILNFFYWWVSLSLKFLPPTLDHRFFTPSSQHPV